MRLRKSVVVVIIGFIGLLLCAGNLWFTAEHSLIPVSLNALVVGKEIGREKHPGSDDVHWLILKDGRKLHVDKEVYNAVNRGEGLQKSSWSRELRHGKGALTLGWSADARGMLPVMGIGLVIMATMVGMILRKQHRNSAEENRQ